MLRKGAHIEKGMKDNAKIFKANSPFVITAQIIAANDPNDQIRTEINMNPDAMRPHSLSDGAERRLDVSMALQKIPSGMGGTAAHPATAG